MSQVDLYIGRGIVSIGGVDVGLADALAISQDIEEIPRLYFGGTAYLGGVTHMAQRVRSVAVEISLYEYTSTNLQKIMRMSGSSALQAAPATAALTFAGINVADSCAAVTFSAPVWLPRPAPDVQLITGEEYGNVRLYGHVLRNPGGSPQWYSLVLS